MIQADSLAQLNQRASGQLNYLRIPARHARVAARQALADLHQRVLLVPRLSAVGQIFRDLIVAQFAAEPGHVPEQEREQYQQQREERDQEIGALAGHSTHS